MICKVKERAGGETVKVNVSIEEEEYNKACRELITDALGNPISLASYSSNLLTCQPVAKSSRSTGQNKEILAMKPKNPEISHRV